jgi:hypothetical protein
MQKCVHLTFNRFNTQISCYAKFENDKNHQQRKVLCFSFQTHKEDLKVIVMLDQILMLHLIVIFNLSRLFVKIGNNSRCFLVSLYTHKTCYQRLNSSNIRRQCHVTI